MKIEYRKDGWPLCPCCGEDELWSAYYWDGLEDKPPLQAWLDAGLTCYKCQWTNINFVTQVVTPLNELVAL